jgi:hypothetical protein
MNKTVTRSMLVHAPLSYLRLERHRAFKVKRANHVICSLQSGVVRISIYDSDFTELLPYNFYGSNRYVTIGFVTDVKHYFALMLSIINKHKSS